MSHLVLASVFALYLIASLVVEYQRESVQHRSNHPRKESGETRVRERKRFRARSSGESS